MRKLPPDALLRLVKIGFDWMIGFPVFRVWDKLKESPSEPDVQAPVANVERRVEGPYSPSKYREFLALAGMHMGHSTAAGHRASQSGSWC